MLRALKELIKERTLAKVILDFSDDIHGFVTYADEETFEIYTPDSIFNQLIIDESDDGIVVGSEEDIESIDFKLVKHIYLTQSIVGIIADISHKLPVDASQYIDTVKDLLYNEIAKKEAQKNARQSNKYKTYKLQVSKLPNNDHEDDSKDS